jgi:LacI family transcriptional regulator
MVRKTSGGGVRKVLISPKLEGKAGREHLGGILRYLDAGHVWDVDIVRSPAELSPARVRKAIADGAEGFLLSVPKARRARGVLAAIARAKLPAVLLDNHNAELPRGAFAAIRFDVERIVSAGLDFLLQAFPGAAAAFLPDASGEPWSAVRAAAFRKLAKARGIPFAVLSGRTRGPRLREELAALPAPAVLLAANDLTALAAVEACAEAGIDVPGRIAVLGIDNDELICGHSRPPLATLEPDFAGAGRLAAETLERMIDGRSVPRVVIPPESVNRIVVRDSARPPAIGSALVAHALAYIRAEATHVGVGDVARHLGVSRTRLVASFRASGRTVADEIREARFAKVFEILSDPKQAIGPIANFCGWKSETHLMHAFSKRTGMTMRTWRTRHVRISYTPSASGRA